MTIASAALAGPLPRLRRRLGRDDGRLLRSVLAGALDVDRPLMVNLVVTRRCNLSCGYCTEYDHESRPVPLEVLCERLDHLARLRTVIATLTGGETLLHPQLPAIVRAVRERGMIPAINTNGFLLSRARIEALNQAGLYAMQVSVDAVEPNDVTKKALRPLLPKLTLLARHARFRVRVNTVLGAAPPEEALAVVRAAVAFGFDAKCALGRAADGTPLAFDDRARAVHDEIARLRGRSLGLLGESFQDDLLRDRPLDWKCRAGARFFHVCADGLVHLCGPRFGAPAAPLATYGVDAIRRAFDEAKPCAARCAVAYAHQISRIDSLRPQRSETPPTAAPARRHLRVVA